MSPCYRLCADFTHTFSVVISLAEWPLLPDRSLKAFCGLDPTGQLSLAVSEGGSYHHGVILPCLGSILCGWLLDHGPGVREQSSRRKTAYGGGR